ncbi:TetR/AcrR family transcriptional regulator [Streptomyces sp. MAR4 CNX-425]|uniref:TetR/AcrR family transcriptional regulator n=1 Tax=Streptomyces sp. MAR4 CNX-425 TaxID=3406343 RepID=UPI003B509DED
MQTTSRPQRQTRTPGTRERIVEATSRLLQRQGYEGTSVKEIARAAGATLSSVYHFFPGGKQELAVAAIRHGDAEFAELLSASLAREADPAAAVVACTDALAAGLRDSGWSDGCPVTATALETAGRIPEIQRACTQTYEHWQRLVAERLVTAGFAEADARELAWTVVTTIEGAEGAAQVFRSATPLHLAGRHLARLLDAYR